MVAYDELATYTFVLLYNREHAIKSAKTERVSVGDILAECGFQPAQGSTIDLDLGAVASGVVPRNPAMLTLNGGEAYVECKTVHELADEIIELQIGAARFWEGALFGTDHYTSEIRDRLVFCVEQLACRQGFEAGFSIHLGDHENEGDYREWFAECVSGGQFSLSRFVRHEWLSPHAVLVGPRYVREYGREIFVKCPAWKVTEPKTDVLCVFMDNVYPSGALRREKGESHIREALPYLRNALGTK